MTDDIVYRWAGPPVIELHRCEVTLPSGISYTGHWLVTGEGKPGVVVCALRRDELLLVRSLRPSVGRRLWELPRGFVETDEWPPLGEGLRELREETGYPASDARFRGSYVTDSSVLPTTVAVVTCSVDDGAEPGATDGEVVEFAWVPLSEVRALIADGVIADGHSLAGLATVAFLWSEGDASSRWPTRR